MEWLHASHRRAKSDLENAQSMKAAALKRRSRTESPQGAATNRFSGMSSIEEQKVKLFQNKRTSRRKSAMAIRSFGEGKNGMSPRMVVKKSRSEIFGVRRTIKTVAKHAMGKRTLSDEVEDMAKKFEDAGIHATIVKDCDEKFVQGESTMPESKLLRRTKTWLGETIHECEEEENQGKEKHNRRLWHAAVLGHCKMVQNCIRDGKCHIDSRDESGATALFHASTNGHRDVVEYLLQAGARVDRTDGRGKTPLMRAAFNGHADVIGELLKYGANVNAQSKGGWTALMYCVARGNLRAAAALCDADADAKLKNHDGRTAADIADKLRGDKGPQSYSAVVSKVFSDLVDDRIKRRSLLYKN